MQAKMSKLQKVILVYVGVTTKSSSKKYMRRKDVTAGLADLLNRDVDNNFSALISQSIYGLKERGSISKRGSTIGLTKIGKDNAKEIIEYITNTYGKITWDVIKSFYSSS